MHLADGERRSGVAEEPTGWELKRNYETLRSDMRDGFNQLNTRLDRMPTAETLAALIDGISRRQTDTEADIIELRNELKAERARRDNDRRLVIGSILTAVGSIVVVVVSSLIGVPPG